MQTKCRWGREMGKGGNPKSAFHEVAAAAAQKDLNISNMMRYGMHSTFCPCLFPSLFPFSLHGHINTLIYCTLPLLLCSFVVVNLWRHMNIKIEYVAVD